MPAINASEEIIIKRSQQEVFNYLRDFKLWKEWSPWLICEPDATLTFESEDSYSWDGNIIGAGNMTVTGDSAPSSIDYDLTFYKPFKSTATVQFKLEAVDEDRTRVSWQMQSKLPFFLFFLTKMMSRMIAMDYQRGLKMLKEKLETGSVDSTLEYMPDAQIEGTHYVGIRTTCKMEEMEKKMTADIEKLQKFDLSNEDTGQPVFTIYEKWKFGKGEATYVICRPIKSKLEKIAQLPYEAVTGYREPCDAYVVVHTGDYKHLGNAWSSGMMRARTKPKMFAQSKKQMPFELYITDPTSDTSETGIITHVCLPKK